MEENLPGKIVRMIVELHRRGYTSLYLHCGLSASGMYWRYDIGHLENEQWPATASIVYGSVGAEDRVSWTTDHSTVNALANGFEATYADVLRVAEPTTYSIWFREIVRALKHNEVLIFYADFETEHANWLLTAPGYRERV
jgi:hypothetical protein